MERTAAIFNIPQSTESYIMAYVSSVTPESLSIAFEPDVVVQICHLVGEAEAGGVEFEVSLDYIAKTMSKQIKIQA